MPPKNNNICQITLVAGHALMMGHKPASLPVEQLLSHLGDGVQVKKFGLFDTSAPNYTTYYPNVKPTDFKPKSNEFVYPVFRMLSMTSVNAPYNPISFAKGTVLRDSMPLLLGQTVNVDHETATGNAIGVVKEVFWQESYKVGKLVVPAGINAVLQIDGKSNPRLVRGMMMDPPSIHSNSVTIRFSWEKSHPEMTDEDFRAKIGTVHKGKLVEKVANKIFMYLETSLVSHGADPFAQKTGKDGKIVLPTYPEAVQGLKAEFDHKSTQFIYDWKGGCKTTTEKLSANTETFNTINHKPTHRMKKIFIMLGIDAKDPNAKKLALKALKKMKADAEQLQGLTEQVTNLTTERDSLKTKVEGLEPQVAKLQKVEKKFLKTLTSMRTSITNTYKAVHGDNAEAGIISLIEKATVKELRGLQKTYQKEFDDKFPLICQDCGGQSVSRASAALSKEAEQEKPKFRTNAEADLALKAMRKTQK